MNTYSVIVTRTAARLSLVLCVAQAVAGCGLLSDNHTPPGGAGCEFDTSALTGDAVLETGLFGGVGGNGDRWLVRTSGTVLHSSFRSDGGETLESDPAAVANLLTAIEGTGVLGEAEGCYERSLDSSDSIRRTLLIRRGESVYRFQSEEGAGPSALSRAIGKASDFVDQLH